MRSLLPIVLLACNGVEPEPSDPEGSLPRVETDTYSFESRFTPEISSVAYDGQTMRHLLIEDLTAHAEGLTARIDSGFFPAPGEVESELDFYFSFDSATSSSVPILFSTDPPLLQSVYGDVSSDKDLVGKIAGNDPEGQHADWSIAMVGWEEAGVTSPESLVRAWMQQIDSAAVARSNGDIPLGPDGAPVPDVLITAEGQHLGELLQKFLLGAIAFSQGADDYLDDDLPGKGLNSPNGAPDGDAPYSPLEHAWDEGFGYFGAARDYGAWTDALLAGDAHADTFSPDGAIDLLSEVSFGASVNAGKRDDGAIAPTDLTAEAWEGFLEGRSLIASVEGELSAAQLEELKGWRDQAIGAWEAAIAATVVHYINDTLEDMSTFGTPDYSFADHAKHWSEMKGFALSLQFNPRSPLSDDAFEALHAAIGTAPALPEDPDVESYRQGLLSARASLGAAYGFDPANMGDDLGENGW